MRCQRTCGNIRRNQAEFKRNNSKNFTKNPVLRSKVNENNSAYPKSSFGTVGPYSILLERWMAKIDRMNKKFPENLYFENVSQKTRSKGNLYAPHMNTELIFKVMGGLSIPDSRCRFIQVMRVVELKYRKGGSLSENCLFEALLACLENL